MLLMKYFNKSLKRNLSLVKQKSNLQERILSLVLIIFERMICSISFESFILYITTSLHSAKSAPEELGM